MKKITKLTPEQEALLPVYRDKWIAIALSTGRMTADERTDVDRCVRAIYRHAKLPEPLAVVVVPSPRMMAFAGGAAHAWWLGRAATDAATLAATDAATDAATYAATLDATYAATRDATLAATNAATDAATLDATYAATRDATLAATDAATLDATRAATRDATYAATLAATYAATYAATDDATYAATDDATHAATYAATDAATDAATRDATYAATLAATLDATSDATLDAVRGWWTFTQGGNMWSGYESFLDFWGQIIGDRDGCRDAFTRYADWRRLAEISGYRWMHSRFCIVSEKPVKLATEVVRGVHVAHCGDGPSHLWADGFAIWHWHGVRVPQHVIERPETITVDEIKAEKNVEVRRVMRERFGEGKYLIATGAKVIDSDHETCRKGASPRCLVEDNDGQRFLVGTDGSTKRTYYMRVGNALTTCRQAHESLCGFPEDTIINKS